MLFHPHANVDTPDVKRVGDHDESPPLTPTGNAPSSESELDISSPNASHDESVAKDPALRDSDKDLSHRPKRRRCHETYNFNMKCPTPGCNSLGKTSDHLVSGTTASLVDAQQDLSWFLLWNISSQLN